MGVLSEMEQSQFLNQLASENTPFQMKTEEDHDYSNNNNNNVFVNSDYLNYFPHENSPADDFQNIQSPLNSSTSSAGFISMMGQPVNPFRGTAFTQDMLPMNARPGANNFLQPRFRMSPDSMPSNMEQIPDTTIFPGPYGFELALGPNIEAATTKSTDYTFSHPRNKLYVQRGAQCPFKFKTTLDPPPNSYVKVIPVFKGTHVLSEPVKRCSNHAEEEDDALPRYHFIRSTNRQTCYETSETGRLYLTMPYTGPQIGAEFQVELLSFMCFNSCGHSSHSKRRIDVIFMLENGGQVLGRQVIEVRVCACPGRDRTNEECHSPKSGNKAYKRGGYGGIGKNGKRRKLSSQNGEQEYTITTNNPVYYQILQQLLDSLETNLSSKPPGYSSPLSHSPISALSSMPCTDDVFKPIAEKVHNENSSL